MSYWGESELVENELLGAGVHVKWSGITISRFLKIVAERAWFKDIPRTWRSMVENRD